MRPLAFVSLALLTLTVVPGCDKPDVGARCKIAWNRSGLVAAPTPATATGDFFESGNTDCDDLICIVSPAPSSSKYGSCASDDKCGYCSKPCVSDKDCYSSETGLRCEQVVLDPAFIALLDPQTRQRYLNEISFSNYCVVPHQ